MLKKIISSCMIFFVLSLFTACDDSGNTTSASVNTPSVTKGSFADERDGKTYRTVTIGYQTWMAENLDYEMMNDSYCYEYNPDYCSKYGRLYNSIGLRYVCPSGWHLPSASEWGRLFNYIVNYDSIKNLNFEEKISSALMHASFVEREGGSVDSLNKILKEGYESSITVDMFGFSALAAGMNRDGVYRYEGKLAVFWATDGCVTIPYSYRPAYRPDSFCESIVMASVRCIQGPAPKPIDDYDY